MKKVELFICDEGWRVLKVDDHICYEGHSVPDDIWLDLFNRIENMVAYSTYLSDEDMECGKY